MDVPNKTIEDANNKERFVKKRIPWAVACIAVALVTLCVHYRALCEDRTDLSLPQLINSMEGKCRTLGETFDRPLTVPLLHPLPTQFGVAVWVEREQWSLPVHDALDRIDDAIDSFISFGSKVKGTRVIQRLVHVTTKGSDVDRASLVSAATSQQLGLDIARHVYAYDLRGELRMYGISFFCVPPSLHVGESGVQCFVFAERKAYCTIPDGVSAEWLSREIPAAIATLMSRWLSLESFRDAKVLHQWVLEQNSYSCHYALRALRQLQRSVDAHPEMPAPEGVGEAIRRLSFLMESGQFAHFSRAADDLQYHPLFLPQLYIPWDQAFVNHLSILLPVISVGIVGLRTLIAEIRRHRRGRQQETVVDVKKEQ